MQAFESASTWRQPVPRPASAEWTALIATVASWAAALGRAGSASPLTA